MTVARYPIDPSLQAPLTVDQYHRMIEAGILGEDDRVELLEGVLIEMTPQGRPHARFLSRFTALAVPALGPDYRVRVQLPLTLPPYGEPEPDISIVRREDDESLEHHPQAALLVVEVASESLRRDRMVKARVYARHGVPEYWVANVEDQVIEVHRDPEPEAERYRSHHVVRRGERVAPRDLPALELSLDELYG